ncbi:hypothetical protein BDV23DRAFT_151600 [Aspergillus alliaceus]|uniref:Uncharacterized protein n=1 Tax=Petromyces alliaceus TaxID=209559 RepID=A0A5N7CDW9_PETAA|nr:hypothetical protein BDV23DRAFT_151600 [Aspergillus alliaceus]
MSSDTLKAYKFRYRANANMCSLKLDKREKTIINEVSSDVNEDCYYYDYQLGPL